VSDSTGPYLHRRFSAFFATQFLGALNDNVYRNIIVTMLTFGAFAELVAQEEGQLETLLHLAPGLFMLPFLLFSGTGGLVADRYPKRNLIIIIKAAEVALMLMAGIGFATGNITLMMLTLFLMGMQSTFFGPIKYSYLPDIFPEERELIVGNGLVSGSTHISILLGVFLGTHIGGIQPDEGSPILVAFAGLLAIAAAGLLASFLIPAAAAPRTRDPGGAKLWNFPVHAWNILWKRKNVGYAAFTAIIGISWFWLVGALFLTLLPLFVDEVGYPVEVYKFLLLLTCVFVASGAMTVSLVAARRGLRVAPATCTAALVGVSLALMHFGLVDGFSGYSEEGAGGPVAQFFAEGLPAYWALADIMAISFSMGFLIVPLITLMQKGAEDEHRASVVAANNVYNALLIIAGSLISGYLVGNVLDAFSTVYLILGLCTALFCALFRGRLIAATAQVAAGGAGRDEEPQPT